MAAKPKSTKKESFEGALKKLEKVVHSLEEGELSLEDSIKAFEEGSRLAKACEARLNEARKKVEILMGDKVEPFSVDEESEASDD